MIYCPVYSHASGGIQALHLLCHHLNNSGCEAYMTFALDSFGLDTPVIKENIFHFGKEAIAVYPEGISNNPFESKIVVRWLLAPIIPPKYIPEGLCFLFLDTYNFIGKPYTPKLAGNLFMPTMDTGLCFKGNEKKEYKVFYIGKGKFREGVFNRDNYIEITRDPYPSTRKDLAALFRKTEIFYCFDNMSIIPHEAAMCGCPTVIIPDGSRTRENYENNPYVLEGVAWGLEDLERAKQTIDNVLIRHQIALEKMKQQLNEFIKITQGG